MPWRQMLRRAVEVWEKYQVELQGQYSVERLYDLERYSAKTSPLRVAVVLLATPLPCLAVVTLADMVPLEDPSRGLAHSHMFWLRTAFTTTLFGVFIVHQFRFCIDDLHMNNAQLLLISILSGCGATAVGFFLSYLIGFPMPFIIQCAGPSFVVILVIAFAVGWGRLFSHNTRARHQLRNAMGILMVQWYLTLVYPVYNAVFVRLDGARQATFALVLPIIKLGGKNAMARFCKDMEDATPEVVVMNIEIFHALFTTYCMQGTSSMLTVAMIMGFDAVLAWSSLHEVDVLASDIRRIGDKPRSLLRVSDAVASLDKSRIRPVLRTVMRIAKTDPLVRDSGAVRLASSTRSRKTTPPSLIRGRSIVPTENAQSLPLAVASDRHTTVMNSENGQKSEETAHGSSVSPIRVDHPDLLLMKSGIDRLTPQERLEYVQKTLQLLHLTEFVLLVEFVEIIIPLIYGSYLLICFQLPIHEYYTQLHDVSPERLRQILKNVLIYALLEFISFIMLHHLLRRKLRLAPIYQLSFVLETQWSVIQSKLPLWMIFMVQQGLEHFGVDYTFQFKWLRRSHTST
ncbi:hypothetical protein Poli38472_002102 [Pythium oligandrum]|uniref:Uncharacterized protein n=1 Tax=Pythium oligandrum TaxID=41045 RepID=A0A8K1CI20_PYTOL|nr:hypothetical protein Poli38472_002102 [Pythium oligandrum]|eukprot:TMW63161.1 hypothetical protein Poli38472_002102 [Pythium oligandrum]